MPAQVFSQGQDAIHYRRCGKGPLLLLLHGFGEDSRVFDAQVAALEQDYSLVIPDIPGSGNSPYSDTWCLSIDRMATAMHDLMEHTAEGEAFAVVGHSMGGYIALAMAEQQPSRLLGLGLLHSTAFADGPEKKIMRQKAIEFIREKGGYTFLKTAIPGLFAPAFLAAPQHQARVNTLTEASKAFSEQALIAYYTSMMERPDRTHVLAGLQVPALFIVGRHDQATPLTDLLKQVHLPADAEIHIISDIGHMGMIESPDEISRILSGFMRRFANR